MTRVLKSDEKKQKKKEEDACRCSTLWLSATSCGGHSTLHSEAAEEAALVFDCVVYRFNH